MNQRESLKSVNLYLLDIHFTQLYTAFEFEAALSCKARISSLPPDITVRVHFARLKLKFNNVKYLTQHFEYPITETETCSFKYLSY
jgi:hypothetical protein